MADPSDEARRLREFDDQIDEDLSRIDAGLYDEGAPAIVGRTTTLVSYPASANVYFALNPVTVLGAETEGGAALLSYGSNHFMALNLGSIVPPNGTNVLCTYVGNRWVFRY